jgi:tetratricopeptide (TPR) repeat protein
VDVKSVENTHTEALTYNFVEITENSVTVALDWEKKRIPFKIEFDVNEIVLANIRNEMRSLPGFSWQGPLSAAQYCLNNNINHEEALRWVELSINRNKNFNNIFVKASLLAQTGKTSDYDAMIEESIELANIGQRNFLGYQLLGQNKNDLAIKVFKVNVEKNPENANVHDSLGEAYKTNGDNELAIETLKKSLSLNPPANVRANSIKLLTELGVDTKNL